MPSTWERLNKYLDWSGVGEATPEYIGRENISDPILNAGMSLATLPKRTLEASEAMRGGYGYDPAPAVEAAMLPMGTGAVTGVGATTAEQVLGAGMLRKQPPLISGYHGTIAPEKFTEFKPSTVDFGTHFDRDPNIALNYAMGNEWGDALKMTEGARTYPVVGDIKKPLSYPTDPVNWRDPEAVIEGLAMAPENFKAPKGLLADMSSAAKSAGGWEKNFIPMLKDRKVDSIVYPSWMDDRYGMPRSTSYMALEPSQVMPRYSPEAQELIKARGVKEPMKQLRMDKRDILDWREMPEAERWLPPPSEPKPSSYTPGLTINSTPTTIPIDRINEAFEMMKKGMLSADEYFKLFGK